MTIETNSKIFMNLLIQNMIMNPTKYDHIHINILITKKNFQELASLVIKYL